MTAINSRRTVLLATALAGAIVPLVVAGAGPASATPAAGTVESPSAQYSCTADVGDPTGLRNITTVKSATVSHGGRSLTIELRRGTAWGTGVEYAWSRISGAHEGDMAWLDLTEDSTATRVRCGATTDRSSGVGQWWTDGFYTLPDAVDEMRACGGIAGPGGVYDNCTGWW